MVAMPLATAGASLKPGTFTAVPSRMWRVCWAARASTAQQLDRIIGLSVTQQWLNPRFSAWVMKPISSTFAVTIPKSMPWSLSDTFGDEALKIPWKIPVPLEAPRVNQ